MRCCGVQWSASGRRRAFYCSSVLVRPATLADVVGIAEIYDKEVLHGIATFMTVPWTPDEWRQWFTDHQSPRHPVVVAVDESDGERVRGFASLSAWSPRQAYDRTAESSVYVAEGNQGKGIGEAMMREVTQLGKAGGVCVLVARVVEQNPGSVRFHERIGFGTVGIMRRVGEKFGRLLDVRMMDMHLDR